MGTLRVQYFYRADEDRYSNADTESWTEQPAAPNGYHTAYIKINCPGKELTNSFETPLKTFAQQLIEEGCKEAPTDPIRVLILGFGVGAVVGPLIVGLKRHLKAKSIENPVHIYAIDKDGAPMLIAAKWMSAAWNESADTNWESSNPCIDSSFLINKGLDKREIPEHSRKTGDMLVLIRDDIEFEPPAESQPCSRSKWRDRLQQLVNLNNNNAPPLFDFVIAGITLDYLVLWRQVAAESVTLLKPDRFFLFTNYSGDDYVLEGRPDLAPTPLAERPISAAIFDDCLCNDPRANRIFRSPVSQGANDPAGVHELFGYLHRYGLRPTLPAPVICTHRPKLQADDYLNLVEPARWRVHARVKEAISETEWNDLVADAKEKLGRSAASEDTLTINSEWTIYGTHPRSTTLANVKVTTKSNRVNLCFPRDGFPPKLREIERDGGKSWQILLCKEGRATIRRNISSVSRPTDRTVLSLAVNPTIQDRLGDGEYDVVLKQPMELQDCSLIEHLSGNKRKSGSTSSTLTLWGQVASATSRDLSVYSTDVANDLARFMLTSGVLHPKALAIMIRNRDLSRGHWSFAPRLGKDSGERDRCRKALHAFNVALHHRDESIWPLSGQQQLLIDPLLQADANLIVVHHLSSRPCKPHVVLDSRSTHTRLSIVQPREVEAGNGPLPQTVASPNSVDDAIEPMGKWFSSTSLSRLPKLECNQVSALKSSVATAVEKFAKDVKGDYRQTTPQHNLKQTVRDLLIKESHDLLQKFVFTNRALNRALDVFESLPKDEDLTVALFPTRDPLHGNEESRQLIGVIYGSKLTPAELDLEFLKFRSLYGNVAAQMADEYTQADVACLKLANKANDYFPGTGTTHDAWDADKLNSIPNGSDLLNKRDTAFATIARILGLNAGKWSVVEKALLLKGLTKTNDDTCIAIAVLYKLTMSGHDLPANCKSQSIAPRQGQVGGLLRALVALKSTDLVGVEVVHDPAPLVVKVTVQPDGNSGRSLKNLARLVSADSGGGGTSKALRQLRLLSSQYACRENGGQVRFDFTFNYGTAIQ